MGSIMVCALVAEYLVLNRTIAPLVRKRQPADSITAVDLHR
ncbi:hypothetical protein [Amycolatopsis rubida]|nr:hypothetical protein [Amycolatopsis rubida]